MPCQRDAAVPGDDEPESEQAQVGAFLFDRPPAGNGAASLVESTQVAKFVISRATEDVSGAYPVTIFAATRALISCRCSAVTWFIDDASRAKAFQDASDGGDILEVVMGAAHRGAGRPHR